MEYFCCLSFLIVIIMQEASAEKEEPFCRKSEYEVLERLIDFEKRIQSKYDKLDGVIKTLQGQTGLVSSGPIPYIEAPLSVAQLEVHGWTMVFLAMAGNGDSAYAAWISGTKTTNQKPDTMRRSLSTHYRDPGIDSWSTFNIKYVKFALFEERREVAYVIFNAVGSDKTSWFQSSRVTTSSWPDLLSSGTYNMFSIVGHEGLKRRFHINSEYAGCPKDRGYIVASDGQVSGCEWDSHPSYPQFLYSKISSADLWVKRDFGRADFLVVFVYM